MYVQCTSEYIRESDDIINLVRIIRATSGHQYVWTAFHSILIRNFRYRIGQCKDDRVLSHGANHILSEYITLAQSYEYVCTVHCLCQSMDIAAVGGKLFFLFCKFFAVTCDDTFGVQHDDILFSGSQGYIELRTTDGGCTGTIHDNLHLGDVLSVYFQCILQSGSRDNSCTVLVIMHNRNIECTLQTFFNIKTLRCLDILQIDTTESRSDTLYSFAEFLRVLLSHFYIKYINTSVNLKQKAFTFHYWFTTHGSDVTKTQHCGTVTDYSYQITLIRISIRIVRILLNLQTGISYARGIRQTYIRLRTISFRRLHFDFSRSTVLMI